MKQISNKLQSDSPVKWLFYGDSITHGALHTFGYRDYPELFSERIRFELGRSTDIVINSAISGHTTRQLLDGYEWRVAQFEPHVMFLMIGMNDCSRSTNISVADFSANLDELVDRNDALDTLTVMQTTCPILKGTAPDREAQFDDFMQVIRDVAERRELPLIDHTAHWRDNADKHFYWMSNAFHPNEYGHRVFANLLFRRLDVWDDESFTCRLYVP